MPHLLPIYRRSGSRIRRLASLAALVLLPAPAGAQDVGWSIENTISGSLFFGNTRQTLITTRSSIGHADSTFELKGTVRFTYGEISDENDEPFVSKRSWIGTLSYDHHPFARYSTFLTSTLETSLEKRIDFRYDFGVGEKLTFVRTETTSADVSVALLGERTWFPPTVPDEAQSLLRWSARGRYRRQMNDRVRVSHETSYAPVVNDVERYTITSTTSMAVRLARYADLNVSFLDNYDSEAKARGARAYNDGQLVLGIQTAF